MIPFDYSRSMIELSDADLAQEVARTGETLRKLPKWGFTELPYTEEIAQNIQRYAASVPAPRHFVQIGIGGSALGATALASALGSGRPHYHVLDNVDPEETEAVLSKCDPAETIYHVVTKSGETTETLSTLMLAWERARAVLGADARQRFVATTGARGFLRTWATAERVTTFDVPEHVGGRFSVLCPVGLVPAAFLGIDVRGLLTGAVLADEACRRSDPMRNPAYLLAAIPYLLDTKRGKRIHVMMPYAKALKDVADWWRQLWAESLGKKPTVGPTPVLAVGATDQHSQVQLYNEGPNDKWFLFLSVEKFRSDPVLPAVFPGQAATAYLEGKRMSDVLRAMKLGTEEALTANGRPNATLTLPEISARTIGGLLYMLEMSTAIAGTLYGVNAFDQPGVEAGKKAAFSRLGREGYPPPPASAPNEKYLVR